jgi:epoxyqueuosine reductase QueG
MTDFIELKRVLLEKGASFVGFSDISDIKNNRGYKGAVTVGIKLLDSVVKQIYEQNAPTYEYFHHYRTVNYALDQLALFAALTLEKNGCGVLMIPASQSSVADPYSGAFPHKTAAVKSNLGFIGKSGLFIHKDYGSMVRLATVLVDIPLTPDTDAVNLSCGDCNACKNACPASAIKGVEYKEGMPREDILDAEKCSKHMKSAYKDIGRGAVCGICIAVCPYNKINRR